LKLSPDDPAALKSLTPEQLRGKVPVLDTSNPATEEFFRRPISTRPLVIVLSDEPAPASQEARLRDASASVSGAHPVIVVWDEALRTAIIAAKDGTVSLKIPPPTSVPVRLRNVAGVLRGSDPSLKETCVLVTAHYDHLGVRSAGDGDHIYNGANDDASGTGSVIEIAVALASLSQKPRRSIVFMTFFGEEIGLLGSKYYSRHPLFPLAKTVAQINLEHLGRTDGTLCREWVRPRYWDSTTQVPPMCCVTLQRKLVSNW